jgi:hypothetical protein
VLVVLFGLNTFASNQIAFPLGMRGPDVGFHVSLIEYIYQTGNVIGRSETYGGFPGQHLISSTTGIVGGLPAEFTYLFVGTLAMTLGILLTYSVAIRAIGERYALLAMLIYASMSYVVFRGGHPTQQAHILPILFLLFVTTMYLYYQPSTRNVILFLLFGVLMVATHHHTSFQAGAMLVALYLGYGLFGPLKWASRRLFFRRVPDVEGSSHTMTSSSLGVRLSILFAMVYAVHIVFTSGYFPNIVGHVAGFFVSTTEAATEGPRESLSSTARFAEIQTEQFLINTTGEGILFGLAVVGGLASIMYHNRTLVMLITWFVIAGFLAVIGTVIDFPFIIPQRVYVTTQMTAIGFLAAFGIITLMGRGVRSRVPSSLSVGLLTIVIFALVFFSTASTIAGIGTSPFNENIGYSPQYDTVQEVRAEKLLDSVGSNPDSVEWARGFVQPTGTINYSSAEAGMIGVNHHELQTGVSPVSRSGIGSEPTVYPRSPTAGLEKNSRVYHNGLVELYNHKDN